MSANDERWLAGQFERHRAHLRAVAYRMLGSASDADDAVQESWLRLSRSDTSGVDNLSGWLTTVVARICLDVLRSRDARREEALDADVAGLAAERSAPADAEHDALLADSVGVALLVVLETLGPAERVAFVLHDIFDLPFEEIAPVVGRSPAAARQLASRARRRVQGRGGVADASHGRRRAVIDAFLAASRAGDFTALLALLDPDVVLRADAAASQMGAPGELRGAESVARQFSGRAQAARPALVDGEASLVWASAGRPRVVFVFTVTGDAVTAIDLVADPARLEQFEITWLDPGASRRR